MKSFLIIGMGSFGKHLCRSFSNEDCEMMIVDRDEANLEGVLSLATSARIGDCTSPEVLQSFGVGNFDACFVCMGTNFQNSLQITSLLKELGAKKVYSKADEDIQAKFLLRNGADEVIYPEKDAAEGIAIHACCDSIFDAIEIADDYFVMEIEVLPEWIGKTVIELDFRNRYKMNIMAMKKENHMLPMPSVQHVFAEGEHMLVLGHIDDIKNVVN
ncbi:MAG: TrkA family potassium uptake protein [Bacillota bacterium]